MPTARDDKRPAAFFDRDGVLNVDHGYVHDPDHFDPVEGAAETLRLCHDAGYLVFVVTNQSGVARGYFDEAAVRRLHDHMIATFRSAGAVIDDIRFCPHHEDGAVDAYRRQCDCRKPAPGMLLDLIDTWNVDVARSFLIGDKRSDIEAAEAAGVTGHLFEGGNLKHLVAPLLARALSVPDQRTSRAGT